MKFAIRDLFWMILVVAIACSWFLDTCYDGVTGHIVGVSKQLRSGD